MELNEKEQKYLNRQIGNVQLYLYFSVAGVIIAISMVAFHFWKYENFGGTQMVLALIILLMARGNLKQHKDAKLLKKLSQNLQKTVQQGS